MIDELKTDYKDDVLATSQQGKRTFNIVGKNGEILFEDVHIEDTSKYTQVGDEYGQEIINEQNSAINQLSKGTGYVFDTYAEYLEAYQGGEIPNGAIVYIKEGSVDGTITALQVKYNDSNVKLALDTLGTRVTQLNSDFKAYNYTIPLGSTWAQIKSTIFDNLPDGKYIINNGVADITATVYSTGYALTAVTINSAGNIIIHGIRDIGGAFVGGTVSVNSSGQLSYTAISSTSASFIGAGTIVRRITDDASEFN